MGESGLKKRVDLRTSSVFSSAKKRQLWNLQTKADLPMKCSALVETDPEAQVSRSSRCQLRSHQGRLEARRWEACRCGSRRQLLCRTTSRTCGLLLVRQHSRSLVYVCQTVLQLRRKLLKGICLEQQLWCTEQTNHRRSQNYSSSLDVKTGFLFIFLFTYFLLIYSLKRRNKITLIIISGNYFLRRSFRLE